MVADRPSTIGALAIAVADEDEATLKMLTGFNLDLARQITQTSNRVRGLFPHHWNVFWARSDAKLKKHGAHRHTAWTETIIDALAA